MNTEEDNSESSENSDSNENDEDMEHDEDDEYNYNSDEDDGDDNDEGDDEYHYPDESDENEENPNRRGDLPTSSNSGVTGPPQSSTTESAFSSASPYSMTSSVDLKKILDKRITSAADYLQLRKSVAHALLRHYGWNEERLNNDFWTDPIKAVTEAGVLARYNCSNYLDTTPPPQSTNTEPTTTCTICYDDLPANEMLQMPCKHPFCPVCWTHFLTAMLDSPLTCIRATCPHPSCPELITEDEVQSFAPHFLPRYHSLQLRSFAELDDTSRWCPAPGCDRIAISTKTNSSNVNIVVTCDAKSCHTKFCLKCGNEPHAPVRCDELVRWRDKCRNESETANWILTNTKACPKCDKRIEKNQGCNHMTCPCKHEFCWICQKDWKGHAGNYNCNIFKTSDSALDLNKAKKELCKYLHHYQRYHAHDEAQGFATRELTKTIRGRSEAFLDDANALLVNCRRVLKYTYCFAYYMKEKALITGAFADFKMDGSTGGWVGGYDYGLSGKRSAGVDGAGVDASWRSGSKIQSDGDGVAAKPKSGDGNGSGVKSKFRAMLSRGNGDYEAAKQTSGHKGIVRQKTSTGMTRQTSVEEKSVAKIKKEQFEYHQKMLESFTDTLNELTEKPEDEIDKTGIVDKTKVLETYLKNILQYCEEEF